MGINMAFVHLLMYFFPLQQIDEMLAGSLSQEDEEAVLAELEAITQVRSFLSFSAVSFRLCSLKRSDLFRFKG